MIDIPSRNPKMFPIISNSLSKMSMIFSTVLAFCFHNSIRISGYVLASASMPVYAARCSVLFFGSDKMRS